MLVEALRSYIIPLSYCKTVSKTANNGIPSRTRMHRVTGWFTEGTTKLDVWVRST